MQYRHFDFPVFALVTSFLALAGCSPETTDSQCFPIKLERPMLILESDWANASALARIDENGCFTEVADISLGADPDLARAGSRPFVCVRDKGVVLEIDKNALRATQAFPLTSGGNSPPNPQDVAVTPEGDILVTQYDRDSLLMLRPDGSFRREISLAAISDPDGIPEMTAIHILGDHAFVALELLPRPALMPPVVAGEIAVIDLSVPDAAAESFTLAGANPFGHMIPAFGDLSGETVSMAMPGHFDSISTADGIEVIHLASRQSERVIDEDALGGSAVEAVIAGPDEGYAIVSGPVAGVNPTKVVRFDPSRGVVTQTLSGPAQGFYHSGLAINGEYLVFGDGTPGAPRIVLVDRKTGAEVLVIAPKRMRPIAVMTL